MKSVRLIDVDGRLTLHEVDTVDGKPTKIGKKVTFTGTTSQEILLDMRRVVNDIKRTAILNKELQPIDILYEQELSTVGDILDLTNNHRVIE